MDLISISRREGKAFELRVRGHALTIDMSKEEGGADEGMNPVELLAGSLGACIAILVQGYCDRHGYDGDVGVSLTTELADDPKRVGGIVVDLELPDGVPEERIPVIKKLAQRCPIHATLVKPPGLDIDVV